MLALDAWMATAIPIGIEFIAGFCYGYLFLIQQRIRLGVAFLGKSGVVFLMVFRMLIAWFAAYYLLRQAWIPSILGAIAFLIAFWLAVLRTRILHERVWCWRN